MFSCHYQTSWIKITFCDAKLHKEKNTQNSLLKTPDYSTNPNNHIPTAGPRPGPDHCPD